MASGSEAMERSQGVIARLLRSSDRNVLRLAKLISATPNFDNLLLTFSYTMHLVHALLVRATEARLARAAAALAERISSAAPGTLLPGETLIATIEPAADSRLVRAEQGSKALLAVVDDVRTFLRLKGLINMWAWGSRELRSPNPDGVLHAVALLQCAACATFQALENTAYLASKGVVAMDPARIAKLFKWSARAWTLHVFLEFYRLLRSRSIRLAAKAEGGAGEKESKAAADEERAWWSALYVNAAWSPLAVNWSLPAGQSYAGEATVAILGGFTGWANLIKAWKATA